MYIIKYSKSCKMQGTYGCTRLDVRLSDKRNLAPNAPESRGLGKIF